MHLQKHWDTKISLLLQESQKEKKTKQKSALDILTHIHRQEVCSKTCHQRECVCVCVCVCSHACLLWGRWTEQKPTRPSRLFPTFVPAWDLNCKYDGEGEWMKGWRGRSGESRARHNESDDHVGNGEIERKLQTETDGEKGSDGNTLTQARRTDRRPALRLWLTVRPRESPISLVLRGIDSCLASTLCLLPLTHAGCQSFMVFFQAQTVKS